MFQVSELLSGVKTRVAHPGLLSIGIVLAKNRYGDYCSQNPYEKLFSRSLRNSPLTRHLSLAHDWIRRGCNTFWTFWVTLLTAESRSGRASYLSDCPQILRASRTSQSYVSKKIFFQKNFFFVMKCLFENFCKFFWAKKSLCSERPCNANLVHWYEKTPISEKHTLAVSDRPESARNRK